MNPCRLTLLVVFAAAQSFGAETAAPGAPSIFAPAPSLPPVSSPAPPALPTSSHIRLRIASLAAAIPLSPPAPVRTFDADSTEPIPMAPFVVEEKPIPVKTAPPKKTFLEAVRSGRLWTSESGKYEVFSFGEVGGGGHARITLGLSIDF